jgi:hypothetical protein
VHPLGKLTGGPPRASFQVIQYLLDDLRLFNASDGLRLAGR